MQLNQSASLAKQKRYDFAGRHLLASYLECDSGVISDAGRFLDALRRAAVASGVTILAENVHQFPNGGVTAVLLLAESHASIHTYPEHGSCFVDFFTCGKGDLETFDSCLRRELKCADAQVRVLDRGA